MRQMTTKASNGQQGNMSPQFRPVMGGDTCIVEAVPRNNTEKKTLTHPLLCWTRHGG